MEYPSFNSVSKQLFVSCWSVVPRVCLTCHWSVYQLQLPEIFLLIPGSRIFLFDSRTNLFQEEFVCTGMRSIPLFGLVLKFKWRNCFTHLTILRRTSLEYMKSNLWTYLKKTKYLNQSIKVLTLILMLYFMTQLFTDSVR